MSVYESLEKGGTITAKIIELGLAKPAPDAPAETAISTPGAFAGTPDFASPEQFAGVQLCYPFHLYVDYIRVYAPPSAANFLAMAKIFL
jgi:serine/threonine protein kinase